MLWAFLSLPCWTAAAGQAAPPSRLELRHGSHFTAPNVAAGSEIILSDGTYQDVSIEIASAVRGTVDRPVTIRPATARGLVLTGKSTIRIGGSHVVVKDIVFQATREDSVIITGDDNRLQGSIFRHCGNPANTRSHIVSITSTAQRNEVASNEFTGSISMSVAIRAGGKDATEQPVGNRIVRNAFRDIKRLSGNGQEPIQIAGPSGGGSPVSLGTLIEGNLFERAEGDREAISIKAGGTVVRRNLFRDMDAAINLRGAPDNIIEGNLSVNTRSMRVAGRNNRILNNFFINPRNGPAIILVGGSDGYEVAEDTLIAHNTIVASKAGIQIGWESGLDERRMPVTEQPRNNTIVNNIIVVRASPRFVYHAERMELMAGNRIFANIFWSANATFDRGAVPAPASANLVADPGLHADGDMYRLTRDSPAIGRGVAGMAVEDFFGRRRSRVDVGAEHFDDR